MVFSMGWECVVCGLVCSTSSGFSSGCCSRWGFLGLRFPLCVCVCVCARVTWCIWWPIWHVSKILEHMSYEFQWNNSITFKKSFEYHGTNLYQLCRIFMAMVPKDQKFLTCSYLQIRIYFVRVSQACEIFFHPSLISSTDLKWYSCHKFWHIQFFLAKKKKTLMLLK